MAKNLLLRTTALAAIAALAVPLSAQHKLGPRSFFPVDHDIVFKVDMKRVVDAGLWDPVERSVFRPLLHDFYRTYGFDLADLDRITGALRFARGDENPGIPPRTFVLEGSERVGLAKLDLEKLGGGYERVTAGDLEYFRAERAWSSLYVSPQPGVVVIGQTDWLEKVIRGEARGGVAAPEVEAVVAGRGRLALIAGRLPTPPDAPPPGGNPWPSEWESEDDPVDLFLIGLNQDRETGDLAFEAVFRFANGKGGPQKFADGARATIDQVRPQAKALWPLFDKLELDVEDHKVTATVELGAPEAAFGLVGTVAALLWRTSTSVEPQVIHAEEIRFVPPKAGDKKKGGGKEPPTER